MYVFVHFVYTALHNRVQENVTLLTAHSRIERSFLLTL
jgi:hypothetical protein